MAVLESIAGGGVKLRRQLRASQFAHAVYLYPLRYAFFTSSLSINSEAFPSKVMEPVSRT